MKTYTAKAADMTTVIESIYTGVANREEWAEKEAAKIRKLAAKTETSFYDAAYEITLKAIKFGAIKIATYWYPVVDGEVQRDGYTHSGGAMSQTVHMAGQRGVTVKA
jgi:hypothetical protein